MEGFEKIRAVHIAGSFIKIIYFFFYFIFFLMDSTFKIF